MVLCPLRVIQTRRSAHVANGYVAKDKTITELDTFAFLDVVFAEWNRLGPKAGVARHFICTAADLTIAKVRESAQRDFDEAVAVSADGTKIIKAKWMLVGS